MAAKRSGFGRKIGGSRRACLHQGKEAERPERRGAGAAREIDEHAGPRDGADKTLDERQARRQDNIQSFNNPGECGANQAAMRATASEAHSIASSIDRLYYREGSGLRPFAFANSTASS
jgi:hypothetical protein